MVNLIRYCIIASSQLVRLVRVRKKLSYLYHYHVPLCEMCDDQELVLVEQSQEQHEFVCIFSSSWYKKTQLYHFTGKTLVF
jgi:hypothetical protein